MTTSIYIILILVFTNILTLGVFLIMQKMDKHHIEKLEKDNKDLRMRSLQQETARLALIRQINENKELQKRLQSRIKVIRDMDINEALNEL